MAKIPLDTIDTFKLYPSKFISFQICFIIIILIIFFFYRNCRKPGDPQTPNKYFKYSRRSFDILIKNWKRKLHKYDNVFVEED